VLLALEHIRRMRGGAQGHLILAADRNAYVVKFQNNPQHVRVLANELIATRLAAVIGLSVPACEVINVAKGLVESSAHLDLDLGSRRERCQAGSCFGSRFVGGLMPGHLFDYLPEDRMAELTNLREFGGILAFDKWTCNVDGRQAVYSKKAREKYYTATFIDFGYCFNAGEWVLQDAPLRGVFARNVVYGSVTGWESLEPWLTRIEELDPQIIWNLVATVPPEWYGDDLPGLEALVERLTERRDRVRELITNFRQSSRTPFPNWGRKTNHINCG